MSEIVVLSKNEFTEIIEQTVKLAVEKAQEKLDKPFPEVMNTKQLCAYLNCSLSTIRGRINDSGLPVSYSLGVSSPRYIKAEIDNWMRAKQKPNKI